MEYITDPDNYRELSRPFETSAAANESLNLFMDAVRDLRKLHRIPDVLVVVAVNVKYNGGEGRAMSHSSHGDFLNSEALAAYAYGRLAQDRKSLMNRMLAGKSPE